jgi:hypothetical protein
MKHYAYNSPFKMVDKKGNKYTLRVEQYDMAESPREWSNVAKMICWHRHYNLGDKHNYDDSFEFLLDVAREVGIYTDAMEEMTDTEIMTELRKGDSVCIVPLNLYDHSGITISTSNGYPYNDRWDAGCVGFIYVTKKRIFDECGGITEENWKERADKYLEGEMETYDQYCRDEVYGFRLIKTVVKQETCPHCGEVIREYEEEIEEDSCWGFYGDCLEDNGILDNIGSLKFAEEE